MADGELNGEGKRVRNSVYLVETNYGFYNFVNRRASCNNTVKKNLNDTNDIKKKKTKIKLQNI